MMKKLPAIIVDIDGTISTRMRPDGTCHRGPYEYDKVGEDDPIKFATWVAEAWAKANPSGAVFFVSGREESCKFVTHMWLNHHCKVPWSQILMREDKDNRADSIVKEELYLERIKPKYDVHFVLDDRQSVVDMWKEQGLNVLQVHASVEVFDKGF